jgi:hypothetical protein
VSAERAAKAAVWLAGAFTMLELLLFCRIDEAWLPFVTFLPPILTMGFAVGPLVRREWRKLALVALVALAVHVLIGFAFALAIGVHEAGIIAIIVAVIALLFALTAIATAPVLVVAAALGARRDLEAGDAMLAWGGAWLVVVQAIALALVNDTRIENAWACSFVTVVGLAFGVLALGTYVARAIARRHWCTRVARGELQGWRVRETTSSEELAQLPPMFGSPRAVSGVLERVEMGGVLYRSGLLASAVAAVRVRRTFGASEVGGGFP